MFMESCLEQLSGIESAVLDLERAPPTGARATIEAVFRAAHTIKGDAAAMGAVALAELCHAVEGVLSQVRDGKRPFDVALGGELLQAFDLVRTLVRRIRQVLADPGRAAGMVAQEIARLAALAAGPPPDDQGFVPEGGQAACPPPQVAPQTPPGAALPSRSARDETLERIESIAIPAGELDVLVDRVGELGIVQARLESLARRLGDREFLAVAEETGRLCGLLRDQALGMRMLPLQVSFLKYRRLVRDACATLGKEAELVLEGENTELDKTLIERLNTPILHLLRNAVDHGVETPAARRLAGKPPCGRISLCARQEGNEVVIEVADDGAGINATALLEHAVRRGLVDPARTPAREELLSLIFVPGLSTAQGVGALSGRGVGMDAAREGIESLRGSIGVESRPGQGTRFTIRMPVSLAIIDCLEVSSGGQAFFFHLDYVEECLEIARNLLADSNRRVLDLRGKPLPILCLTEFFGLAPDACDRDVPAHAVVVRTGGERFCILVDEVLGQKQAVLKHLGPALGHVAGILGGTVTEEGCMALVLDVPGLAQTALASPRGGQTPS
ncbi:MAG: chemotaxis protein CheA [Desulfovibrionaceae bacterium]|nr:chemotaxis protein CheA [Desulfovibrionaceae bacterium]